MEVISIDFNVSSNWEVSRCNEFVVLVNILIFATLKEFAFNNAGVLLGRLINRNGVVGEEERNDEAAINIFRNTSVQASSITKDFALIINCLEEVFLWLLRN